MGLKKFFSNRFNRYLVIFLAVLAVFLVFYGQGDVQTIAEDGDIESVSVPFLGEIDVFSFSLPVLAIILGLVDGFNPCAMWVLVFLISLILSLNDKKKIWVIVGSFIFASGVLYFLFMTAWLNVFLFVGYMRPVTVLIGLFAIGVGLSDLKCYFKPGPLVCDVSSSGSQKKTMGRINDIVHSPLTWASVFSIIVLAFLVNSIEFACSAGIPAIFTQVLSLSNLSGLQHYGYILLYDLFYMLDDMIIFSLAAFAVSSSFTTRYTKLNKLVGGIIILILGIVLAFMPGILR